MPRCKTRQRKKETLREKLLEINECALLCDGFDDCVVGTLEQFGRPTIVLYDKPKMIAKLMKQRMTEDEASEHFYFNIIGAWAGENTPAFMSRLP
jgi:hypothetical protein